jgi:hypothetical protein
MGEKIRQHQVVAKQNLDELATGLSEATQPVSDGADINFVAKDSYAAIPPGKLLANIPGAISAGVVCDDNLEICKGLIKRRLDAGRKIILPVVYRNQDAH